MIIVRYRGGLGNQMFQYAFSYALSKRFPNEKVYADISHYEIQKEHNGFELNKCFGIQVREMKKSILKKYSPFLVVPDIFNRVPRLIKEYVESSIQFKYHDKRMKEMDSSNIFYYCQEAHNTYDANLFDEIETQLGNSSIECLYLDGLWQDIRYFDAYRNDLKEIFKLPDIGEIGLKGRNVVGIHVRCGDFLKSKFDICSSDYYKKALKIVNDYYIDSESDEYGQADCDCNEVELNVEQPQCCVFTDDIVRAMQIIGSSPNIQYINNGINGSLKDMAMMGCCRQLIISNSTFSFWAAYLNDVDVVVAPKYSVICQNRKYELNTPDSWIRIDNSNE